MTAIRMVLALAAAAAMLAGCGNDDNPILMNLRPQGNGPDEFAILPPRPLELPTDLAALPPPTPGGTNLTDPNPKADAIIALGGNPQASGVPAGDAALVGYASRAGVAGDIRATLATEDLQVRRDNNGRLLERLFDVNVYFKAYRDQSLDQQAELAFWRARGARTPSAPPPLQGE